MKRSRTEVGRWRMLRQVNRRKGSLAGSTIPPPICVYAIGKCGMTRHRNALLFAVGISENHQGTAKCQ
ncbi:YciY family protein [Enterobacter cloacae subsp. cloacae]|nr:YciY family protein [Enterobacter cloacae subsp. cloacae]